MLRINPSDPSPDSFKASWMNNLPSPADQIVMNKLTEDLACPVCDNIPIKMPIPCCPSGHIICSRCLKRINGTDKPCPICSTPIGKNTSYLAESIITSLTDIPCTNKMHGCCFQGSLTEINNHRNLCQFETVECWVCFEQCLFKDFFKHNSTDCFRKDISNRFKIPTETET